MRDPRIRGPCISYGGPQTSPIYPYKMYVRPEYDDQLRRSKAARERRKARAATLRKANREKEPPPPTPTRVERPRDWHDDPGEKGRRIWEWWRSRLLDEICPFVYFKEAVRLVVLVQTSSASIERVFSEVKRILASVGESILEDNLELRLLRRCCKKLEEMTSSWT